MSDIDDLLAAVDEAPEGDSLFSRPSTSKDYSSFASTSHSSSSAKKRKTKPSNKSVNSSSSSKRRRIVDSSDSESDGEFSEASEDEEASSDTENDNFDRSKFAALSGFDSAAFINSLAARVEKKYVDDSDDEEIDMTTLKVVPKDRKNINKSSTKVKQSKVVPYAPTKQIDMTTLKVVPKDRKNMNKSSTKVKQSQVVPYAPTKQIDMTTLKVVPKDRTNMDKSSTKVKQSQVVPYAPPAANLSLVSASASAVINHAPPAANLSLVSASAILPKNKAVQKVLDTVFTRGAFSNVIFQKQQLKDIGRQLFEEEFNSGNIAYLMIELAQKVMKPLPPLKPNIHPIIRFDHNEVPIFEWYFQDAQCPIPISHLINYIDDEILYQSRLIYEFLEVHFPDCFYQA